MKLFQSACKTFGDPAVTAFFVVIVITFFAFLSKILAEQGPRKYDRRFVSKLNDVIADSKRLLVASGQDKKPLLALIHANQARTQLQTAKQFAGEAELTKMTQTDVVELGNKIQAKEQKALNKLKTLYPNLVPAASNSGGLWI